MKKIKEIKAPEQLAVGIALAFTGGFLDAYSYILRGGVFANAQTGNMVLLGISLSKAEILHSIYYLIPIAAFALGVFVTDIIQRTYVTKGRFRWRQLIILVEMMLLFLVGFLPVTVPHAFTNVTIAFVCSVQVASFRSLEGAPYATTMCTGNLRSAMENLSLYFFDKDKKAGGIAFRYFVIIFVFCTGAGAGVIFSKHLGEKSIWVCSLILLYVLVYLFTKGTRENQL